MTYSDALECPPARPPMRLPSHALRVPQVLRVVLGAGNLLNAGSARGGAESIKLDVLLKLGDVKVTLTAPPASAGAAPGAADGAAAAGPVAAEGQGGGPAANGAAAPLPASAGRPPPPAVRTLLEFVAWVVLQQAVAEHPSRRAGGGNGGAVSSALQRSARAGYLAEELGALGDAVRRMETGARGGRAGGPDWRVRTASEACQPVCPGKRVAW